MQDWLQVVGLQALTFPQDIPATSWNLGWTELGRQISVIQRNVQVTKTSLWPHWRLSGARCRPGSLSDSH